MRVMMNLGQRVKLFNGSGEAMQVGAMAACKKG
jgi:hypothetical protein